jgi:all-trans-retinol 13,14-reductase
MKYTFCEFKYTQFYYTNVILYLCILKKRVNRVLIIGSGLGGLLSGFLLSREGMQVTILEKQKKTGGCLQSFHRGPYRFDTGMHYVGSLKPGQALFNYWKYFGLTSRLTFVPMDQNGFDRITIGRATNPGTFAGFPLAQGFDNFKEQLLPFFPGSDEALKAYTTILEELTVSHPLYNLNLPGPASTPPGRSVRASLILDAITTGICHKASGASLGSVLAGNNFLYDGHPATTSLESLALINHSFISSAFRIADGSQQIADFLANGIRFQGGQVLTGKEVIRIRKPGAAFDIALADGERFSTDLLISGIHPARTLNMLEGIKVPRAYDTRISGLKNTHSTFTIYLGLKPDTFPFVNSNRYHHVFPNIWTGTTCAQHTWPCNFVFMTPPVKDQGIYAHTAVVMTPINFEEFRRWEESRSGARDKSYFVFKARKAKQLLEMVYGEIPGLKEAVTSLDISTPLTWRDNTGTPEGSRYGIVKDATHPHHGTIFPKTRIPGLLFTGQNINLHGALGVTIGAILTCGEILGLPHVLRRIKDAC